jgi:hypothetical protein
MANSLSRTQLDYLLMGLVNATIPAILMWEHGSGDVTRHIALVTGFVSVLAFNAALLMGIIARNRRENQVTSGRVIVFCVLLAVASVGATTVGVRWTMDSDDLLKVALSSTPLSEIHPEQKRLFVELLRHKRRNSEEYSRVAAATKPIAPALYSPDSFASPKVIEHTCAAVAKAAGIDFSYFSQQSSADREFRDRIMRIDPASDYLKGVESQSERERSVDALEHGWLSSVTDLYGFAASHVRDIVIDKGELTFSNDAAGVAFSEKMKSSRGLQRRLQEAVQASIAMEARSQPAGGR